MKFLIIKSKETGRILSKIPVTKKLFDKLQEINDPEILNKAIRKYLDLISKLGSKANDH